MSAFSGEKTKQDFKFRVNQSLSHTQQSHQQLVIVIANLWPVLFKAISAM
jgi:hypothetical protein